MKTTINFPKGLVERQYNATVASALITIIVIGIMLILSYNLIDFQENKLISTLIICGILASIIAATTLSFSLKRAVLASNEAPLICKTIEFKESKLEKIHAAVAKDQWSQIEELGKYGAGISMKIELVYTKDNSFAAYQYFKYVPHSFEPCSEIIYLDKESPNVPKFKNVK